MLHQKIKFWKKFYLLSLVVVSTNKSADLYLLDTIQAVVRLEKDAEIITKSDVDRPNLGGEVRPLQDIIFERSIFLDAKKRQIPKDEDAIETYLRSVQRDNNLTDDELKGIFTAEGYTYEEGRAQLQMMQMINTMMDFMIRSNLVVPRKDVIAYYNAHPQVIEPSYTLQRVVIPFSKTKTKVQQKRKLMRALKAKEKQNMHWSELFTINQSDIAEDKKFIIAMKPGNISVPIEVPTGFELFRLKEKTEERLVSLDERYRDIVDILRRPKYEELLQDYKDKLLDSVSITYFNDEI